MREKASLILDKIQNADYILIGASNGLEISEGYNMFANDARYHNYFGDFERKYGIASIFKGFFYPFPSDAESWAFMSRVFTTNLYNVTSSEIMNHLYDLVKAQKHFVVTSNGMDHFALAGFDRKNLFEIEGSYQGMQCASGCHDIVYPNSDLVIEMAKQQKDCKVPEHLLPKCPKCGGRMQPHLAINQYFVRDQAWQTQYKAYQQFIIDAHDKNLVVLEFGIGKRNQMIKAPLMHLVHKEPKATYITFNKNELYIPAAIAEKSIGIDEDIGAALKELVYLREVIQ